MVLWKLSPLLPPPLLSFTGVFPNKCLTSLNPILMSAFGLTCIDIVDPKNVLINQVVRWVWGLSHLMSSKQGGPHPEKNVGHRHSLAQKAAPWLDISPVGMCRHVTVENTPEGVMKQEFEGYGDGACKVSSIDRLSLSYPDALQWEVRNRGLFTNKY